MAKSLTLLKIGRHWKTQSEARKHFSTMLSPTAADSMCHQAAITTT